MNSAGGVLRSSAHFSTSAHTHKGGAERDDGKTIDHCGTIIETHNADEETDSSRAKTALYVCALRFTSPVAGLIPRPWPRDMICQKREVDSHQIHKAGFQLSG